MHPTAYIGSLNVIEPGFIAAAGCFVTTNVRIGRHTHLNLGVTVGHDTILEAYVTANPGAHISGNVVLERGVSMGTGSSIIQGLRVGAGTFVGAGAVVTKNTPGGLTVVGVPAKPLVR